MEFVFLCLTALGLSMDAFAVSITDGMCMKQGGIKHAIRVGLFFGGFQGFMPILGYLGGKTFSEHVQHIDHWIALFLLGTIGGKMIFEAVREICNPPLYPVVHILTNKQLFFQAIATSIDALAMGIGFAVIEIPIACAAGLIASITFICCFIGVYLGKAFGGLFQHKAEILGGVILILLGIKIFTEHIFA